MWYSSTIVKNMCEQAPMQDPVELFRNLPANAKNPCLLHSGQGGKSILAHDPVAKYRGNSISDFKKFARRHRGKLLIGYLSYDLAYQLHEVKKTAKDDIKLPKIFFLAFKQWHLFESSKKTIPSRSRELGKVRNFKLSIKQTEYRRSFEKIQKYLREGEIYQVNLTHRLEARTRQSPRELFYKVVQSNPVDYLAYIEDKNFQILSASPERFIKIHNRKIETCPIKGTRPRGKNRREDEKLKRELLNNKKETAELNMITDLLRNDLGKVSKAGSVKVKTNRLLKKCPTVWHTYSKIVGELKTSPLEALISMFPGGSVTGCPKRRAIQIIDELEPNTRSVYTGCIGYILRDDLDFNIAIRTIIKKGKKLFLQVGGGIVIDSNEQAEFQETLDKAESFMNIIEA